MRPPPGGRCYSSDRKTCFSPWTKKRYAYFYGNGPVDLIITQTARPSYGTVGMLLTYTLAISNAGPPP